MKVHDEHSCSYTTILLPRKNPYSGRGFFLIYLLTTIIKISIMKVIDRVMFCKTYLYQRAMSSVIGG